MKYEHSAKDKEQIKQEYKDFLDWMNANIKAYKKERNLPEGWEYKLAELLLDEYCKKTGQEPHIVLLEDMGAKNVPNLFGAYFGMDFKG